MKNLEERIAKLVVLERSMGDDPVGYAVEEALSIIRELQKIINNMIRDKEGK